MATIIGAMRVSLIDPSAFTPPYDRALAAALAAEGADVNLLTSRFLHGPVPEARGFRVEEAFYRRSSERGLDAPGRRGFKVLEHFGDMGRLRRSLDTDIAHYQWLTFPTVDVRLLPPVRPRLLTAHYILPPEPSARQIAAVRSVYTRMDAVIAHSEHSAARLREEVGVAGERVHVIPHGAFDYLTELEDEAPLPEELAGAERPVVLFFGLLRPYKGIEVLLDSFRGISGAELWIVGNPRMDIAPLREQAEAAGSRVRFVPRFVDETEIPAIFRRADLVVLPYLEAEHSGVIYTGLAFGKAMIATDVGGFGELGEVHGAARVITPGSTSELAAAITELLSDETARAELGAAALKAARGEYSWAQTAARTLALYEDLLSRGR